MTSTSTPPEPTLPTPPTDLDQIATQDASLQFPSFTSQTAWDLGVALRARLSGFAAPCVIDISLAHGRHCLFHATTRSGTSPDHDTWVARKREAVLRFACSTWWLKNKYAGDVEAFRSRFVLGDRAGEYALHGGGWPLRVRGVEGVVAVVVVSGLRQEQDHAVIVQVVGEMLGELEGVGGGGEKKKVA